MDNIFLIGMPGCGKTTIAKELAQLLQYDFLDADEVIVTRAGKTIPELFAVSEKHFRDADETMVYLSQKERTIVACGGGVIKRQDNMTAIQPTGKIFFINRPLKDIIASVETSTRPLLKDGKGKMYVLYEDRLPLYLQYSNHVVGETGSAREIAEQIIAILKEEA